MPEVDSLDELNEQIKGWEAVDEARRISGHLNTIGHDFAAEQRFLRPLPTEVFEPGLVLNPRVDRSSMITVRMVKYSVPAHLIGRRVRVSLRASEVIVFEDRAVVAVHPRCVARGDPLCLIGDSGTSKSHLLIALGTAAAEQGYRVRYTLATKLVNELVEAADDKQLAKTIARYGRVDLLTIDELGYMELDRRGAELLFQVLTEREEKNSIAIASNQSFSGWTDTFTDPRLCAAIVDRLTYNGTIIDTGTHSYRLAHSRSQAAG